MAQGGGARAEGSLRRARIQRRTEAWSLCLCEALAIYRQVDERERGGSLLLRSGGERRWAIITLWGGLQQFFLRPGAGGRYRVVQRETASHAPGMQVIASARLDRATASAKQAVGHNVGVLCGMAGVAPPRGLAVGDSSSKGAIYSGKLLDPLTSDSLYRQPRREGACVGPGLRARSPHEARYTPWGCVAEDDSICAKARAQVPCDAQFSQKRTVVRSRHGTNCGKSLGLWQAIEIAPSKLHADIPHPAFDV